MSDQSNDRIVKSLRFVAKREAEEGEYHVQEHIDWMAADRIERQAKRIEELEGALNGITVYVGNNMRKSDEHRQVIQKLAALKGGET